MNFNYDEATRKQIARSDDVFPPEISRENLVQLLLYLEGEIETRDKTIESLKEEKAKLILFEAKYAQVCPADPIHALSRDSSFVPELQPQAGIGELFDNQVDAIERICDGYNESYRRTLHVAQSAQHRLDLAMYDLDLERKWKDCAVSNEAVQSLREENERLKEEVERNNKAVYLAKKEMDELELKRQAESERQKKIFLFLMNERKELLSTMSEIQFRKNNGNSTTEQKSLIDDLRKQVESLIDDRDSLKNVNKTMKGEIVALKEVARAQEEDLHLLRKNLTGTIVGMSIDRNMEDGSVVMANRIAMSAPSRNLSSSSSFPSDKSRLPRAPGVSPSNIASKTMIAKKTPAMGVSTMRRTVERRAVGGDDASKLFRSSSLRSEPRGQSEPRPLVPSIPSIRPSTLPKSPSNGANVSPSSTPSTLSRLPSKSDGKAAQSVKTKSSLLRAFGK